jgi:riboflavin synthase
LHLAAIIGAARTFSQPGRHITRHRGIEPELRGPRIKSKIFLDHWRALESNSRNKILFTGIIEDLGTVEELKRTPKGAVLRLRTALPVARIAIGDSIAVNGACLTVVAKRRASIAMDVSAETLRRTGLGALQAGERINLERCLTLDKLLGGHMVSGHIDGVGKIVSIAPEGDSRLFTFEVPKGLERYLVEKGSVAVDGVSLTVFAIRGRRFSVALIPHTLKMTTLGHKGPGAAINVESDMLVKYVERILAPHRNGGARKARRRATATAEAKTASRALGARAKGAAS